MSLSKLVWDKWNKEHIKKHGVSVSEVEKVYKGKHIKTKTKYNRNLIFGKTKQGRALTIVISQERQKRPYVVSARDMSKKERRLYLHEQAKAN